MPVGLGADCRLYARVAEAPHHRKGVQKRLGHQCRAMQIAPEFVLFSPLTLDLQDTDGVDDTTGKTRVDITGQTVRNQVNAKTSSRPSDRRYTSGNCSNTGHIESDCWHKNIEESAREKNDDFLCLETFISQCTRVLSSEIVSAIVSLRPARHVL
jgi:hypothetical protein